jgi:hypothetical protein
MLFRYYEILRQNNNIIPLLTKFLKNNDVIPLLTKFCKK